MENKKMAKKDTTLVFLCATIYFVSYITRINYAAVLVEYVKSTGFTTEQASLALTGLAIFYGAGQLISGFMGDIFKPKYLIFSGLVTTTVMNFLLPLCKTPVALAAVWCINGLAQAMMWPPIVKILTAKLSIDDYKKATVKVSYGSQLATVSIYLFAPVCIKFSGWQTVFYIASACAAVMSVIALVFLPDVGVTKRERSDAIGATEANNGKIAFPYVLFISIMFVTLLQGIMRDGVANWLPTYVESEFSVPSEFAILMGVAPPVFTLLCYEITVFFSRKVFKNEMLCCAAMFLPSVAGALVLAFFPNSHVALSVALTTLINGSMHGVNLILTSHLPPYFKKTGRISFISGLINSCTYLGSALSGYGFAAVSTRFGWSGTIAVWTAVCFFGFLVCLVLSKKWGSFKANS